MPLGTSQGGAVELVNPRVEVGLLVVFAPFGILGFSWKIALERRCSLSCQGMELTGGQLGYPRDGDVEEVCLCSCHALGGWHVGRFAWGQTAVVVLGPAR